MDTKGARHLADRIAQQQHWALADSVRDGRQPPADPDGDRLEEIGDGYRLYGVEKAIGANGRPTLQRLRKTLVAGRWETEVVFEPGRGD
jgi:hypothetical protein